MTDSTTPPPPEQPYNAGQPNAGQPNAQPYGGQPAAAPAQPLSESDERLYATLAHAGNILFPVLAPLIIWLIFRERSRFVDAEAKEALNFGIFAWIVYIVSSILIFIIIGIFTWIAMVILALVFGIQGAMAVNKGNAYRYPISLRLVK